MGLSRDFLKGLELDKSTIDAIMAEYGTGVTELKEEIATLKEEKLALKESADNYAKLQAEHKDLEKSFKALEKEKAELTTQKAELETKNAEGVKALKRDYAINKAILKSAPIDEVSYRAHLDNSKIEYDEEKDELVGFEEQDKVIREKYGFLFNQGATGTEHGGIDSDNNGKPLSIADAINQTL